MYVGVKQQHVKGTMRFMYAGTYVSVYVCVSCMRVFIYERRLSISVCMCFMYVRIYLSAYVGVTQRRILQVYVCIVCTAGVCMYICACVRVCMQVMFICM
jgi:hypothetical protein